MGFTGPLQAASASGDAQKVKLLLDQGEDVNNVNQYGRSALLAAAYKGHADVVKLLLDHGADPDRQDPGGWNPLLFAAEYGYVEVAKLLLDHGARIDLRAKFFSWTAYEWAMSNHHFDVADLIKRAAVKRGVELDEASSSGVSVAGALAPGGTVRQDKPRGLTGSMSGGAGSGSDAGSLAAEAAPPPAARFEPPARSRQEAPAVASDVDEPGYRDSAGRPDDFALVIGISKYRDIPEAQFAESDAKAMRRHLLAMGYPEENIVSLIGDRATNSSIAEKLERWFPMNVNARSTVFVYYSGHGAPDAESKQAYLVPWDGQPGDLADTAFPLSRFYKDLNKLPAKQVLVALDSCFSGAGGRSVLASGSRPLVTKIDAAGPQNGKLVVFTASQADQISGTLEDKGHGAFTYYFLKGLSGEAVSDGTSGRVTVGSLFGYLARRVSAAAHRQEREQNPQLLPSVEADGSIRLR